MAGSLLERLSEAIAELADIDTDALDDAELHEAVAALGGLATRLEATGCRLVGTWDRRRLWAIDGSKSPGARLARQTHRRRSDCDRLVHRARDLDSMPATRQAYAAGDLSGDLSGAHVDLVASCNRDWRNAEFAESEQFADRDTPPTATPPACTTAGTSTPRSAGAANWSSTARSTRSAV